MSNTREKTLMITRMGIFTAIVVVLQVIAAMLARLGVFTISLVLVPIVVGAALYGWKSGAWLGFVFGVVVLLTDAGAFLAINVPGTILVCILKGVLAGIAAAFAYKLMEKNRWAAILSAALVCPIVNTGVFLLGCVVFFYDTISEWATGLGYESAGAYMILGLAGVNFIIELAINLCLSPVVLRLLNIVKKPVSEV